MRALVLSGGGSKGAFQVGAVRRLAEAGVEYDAFFGISVGALNAGLLATGPNLVSASARLESIWRSLTTADIHTRWFPFGYAHGLWRKSLRNSRPLESLVRKHFDAAAVKAAGKRLVVGAVSLETLKAVYVGEDDPEIVEAILASSAFPTMLSPIRLKGEWHIDGGVRDVTPVGAAIAEGAQSIDVVLADPITPTTRRPPKNAIEVGIASLGAAVAEIMSTDLELARLKNEMGGKYRKIPIRVIQPEVAAGHDPLDFDPPAIDAGIKSGYEIAEKVILRG